LELGDDDEPEWMVEFAKKDSRRAIAEKRQEFEARLAKIKREEERLKQASATQDRPRKKQVWTSSAETRLSRFQTNNPLSSDWTNQVRSQVRMMRSNLSWTTMTASQMTGRNQVTQKGLMVCLLALSLC